MNDQKKSDGRPIRNEYREKKNQEIQERKYQRISDVISKKYLLDVLDYNKPVFPKTRIVNNQVVAGTTRRGKVVNYSDFDNKLHYSSRDNTTLRKNIRFCRMWFQFLKLCLEVEEKKLKIKDSDSFIKVDRKFYKNWHLQEIKETKNFDTWFRTHKHLFTLKPVEVLSSKDELPKDSFIVSIPKSSNINSVKREIDRLLKDKLTNVEETEVNFSDSKTPYISLHIEYNLLVLAFNSVKRDIILEVINDKYRHIPEAKSKKPSQSQTPDDVFSHTQSVTRKISDAKERMIRVSNGVFP